MASETDIFKVSILGKESIHCGFHLIPYITQTVLSTLPSSTYVLITDRNVASFHLDAFENEFNALLESKALPGPENFKARFLSLIIPPGETSKSREGKAQIEDWLLLNKCTRDTVILALGGGVIGDLVGFVAATLYVLSCLSMINYFMQWLNNLGLVCVVYALCRYRRRCSLWSTLVWAERPPLILLMGRISLARFGNRTISSLMLPFWRLYHQGNFQMEWQRSSRYVV